MPNFYGGLTIGVIIGALIGFIACIAWAMKINGGGKK